MIRLTAAGIEARFAPELGRLDGFTVLESGHRVAPMHVAPWVGTDEVLPEGQPPLMAGLGGDFFCAPFAASEGDSPLHGWPANVAWTVLDQTPSSLRAACSRTVYGATLIKELSLRDGHPFVYQRHVFLGGEGRVTAANHGNVSVPNGARIATSAKACWESPPTQLEAGTPDGRSRLAAARRVTDPTAFPDDSGGTVDLTRYPWFDRTDDFVSGLEAADSPLGWTAVIRPQEGDVYLALRHPRRAPMTMLWQSNGGRDYAPWSGRHIGCLGVEEGAASAMLGAATEADLSGPGALTLSPGGTVEMRHVTGALSWPTGQMVTEITARDGMLRIVGEGGATREVPFDPGFLRLDSDPAVSASQGV